MDELQRFQKLMQERNLSIKELSAIMNKDEKTVYGFLNGNQKFPGYLNLSIQIHEDAREFLDNYIHQMREQKKVKELKVAKLIRDRIISLN